MDGLVGGAPSDQGAGEAAEAESPRTYVGVDLAWSDRNVTGLAVVDEAGALAASGAARSDEDIDAWLGAHGGERAAVVGIDAPIVVPNATGSRACERAVTRAFGAYDAGCYPSNLGIAYLNPPRAWGLAQRWSWSVDPGVAPSERAVALEVYPHAAMVGLFRLGRTLKYKRGPFETRKAALLEAVRLIGGIPELRAWENERWREVEALVGDAGRPAHLDAVEDEIDGVLCAHVAWLWCHDRDALRLYGEGADGCVVAPPPPTHPPAGRRPASR